MSRDVDTRQLEQFQAALEKMKKDVPAIMDELAVGEGKYAVKEAGRLCKREDIIDTGNYQNNFHASEKAARLGKTYRVSVYNNAAYAKPLEYGFRSHFVPAEDLRPGLWAKFPTGMYVGPPGGFVEGKYVLKRAIGRTEQTCTDRLARKLRTIIKRYIGGA